MSYVFISYSHKDKGYAHRLEQELKQRGFDVWLDDRIDYGSEWPDEIEKRLDGCKALILIMTGHSKQSGWVKKEITRSIRIQKKIFPLLLEGDGPWLTVETTQYVDVRGGRLPPTDFYDTLAKVVPRKNAKASEQIEAKATSEAAIQTNLFTKLPPSFRNPFEYDAEYILIPGGRYKYQGKTEKEVSNIYFAKYPVTNKLYRRFIRYLEGKERELLEILPKGEFDSRMKGLISEIEGLSDYMGSRPEGWSEKLRSKYDGTKRFAHEDQPVLGITWFDSRAYCCWLSLLEAADWDLPLGELANLYRLPTEVEWEWAASGGDREYPWAPEKGKPSDRLANYLVNVTTTTPIGSYPEGATPEGLMDMAGNVWEWMEDLDNENEDWRSLRGGSWGTEERCLRCSYRDGQFADDRAVEVGFRVVRSE